MEFFVNAGIELVGMLLGVAMGLGLVVVVIWWQVREYRTWQYAPRLFFLLKIGLPVVIFLLILVVMTVASGISGMEALGVFYLGVFAVLLIAPVATALLAPAFGVPFRKAVNITASLVATMLGLWFGGSMVLNAGLSLTGTNWAYKKSQFDRTTAQAQAASATTEIQLLTRAWRTLPDGSVLLHTRYRLADGFRIAKLQERIGTERWVTNHGFCVDDALNVYTVLRDHDTAAFRVLVHTEATDQYRVFEQAFTRPDSPPFLQLFVHEGEYALELPFQARRVNLVSADNYQSFDSSVLLTQVSESGYEANPCTKKRFITEPFDYLDLTVYVVSLRGAARFRLLPRNVAPGFR